MLKRFFSVFIIVVFFITSLGQAYGESKYNIKNNNDNEIIIVSKNYGSNIRGMVEKDNKKYYYSLNNEVEKIPLQLGNGEYTVKILKNTNGNKYKVIEKESINIKNNDIDVYLSSSQPIYWENEDKLIQLKNELMKDLITDKEKVEAVYNYIVKNIKYDYNKVSNISTDYVPDLDNIITSKKGICYDYAALFAGILRSEGIHTKLIKGYKNDLTAYHAWNEVYLDGDWVLVDTTYDASLSSLQELSMIKFSKAYNKDREY